MIVKFDVYLKCDPQLSRLGIELTLQQRLAFARLERRGWRFGVHFGTENAVELARYPATRSTRCFYSEV